ncbi:hypothetical protein QR685DRAFT_221290 [Neurospora intermedia]|uniref:MARVEL domain-containing protein n=1 Tax=Neurospora intermedia TaxID=5142 RepID=A0ABR3DH34_NEUIN
MGSAAGDIINVAFGIFSFLVWDTKFCGTASFQALEPRTGWEFCQTGLGWVHSGWSSMIWVGWLVFGGGYLFCLLCVRGKTGRER